MRSIEEIQKEIDTLKVKLKSNRISEDEREIIRDSITKLYREIKQNSGNIETKVVPVITNDIIANRENIPMSRFINSHAFKI